MGVNHKEYINLRITIMLLDNSGEVEVEVAVQVVASGMRHTTLHVLSLAADNMVEGEMLGLMIDTTGQHSMCLSNSVNTSNPNNNNNNNANNTQTLKCIRVINLENTPQTTFKAITPRSIPEPATQGSLTQQIPRVLRRKQCVLTKLVLVIFQYF